MLLSRQEQLQTISLFLFHELRAQIAYSDCGGELSYYRTPSGTEIDFVWVRGGTAIGIEVKASANPVWTITPQWHPLDAAGFGR